jgi:hypothetical protein
MKPKMLVMIPPAGPVGHMANGTEVFIDGHKVQGVTDIELAAQPGGLWHAKITVVAEIEFREKQGAGGLSKSLA